MAVLKSLLSKFGIYYGLESCADTADSNAIMSDYVVLSPENYSNGNFRSIKALVDNGQRTPNPCQRSY